jgi:phage portal protein BeeE
MSEQSVAPVDTNLAPDIQKAIHEATGELFQRIERQLAMSPTPPPDNQPKGYLLDPFALLDSVGMGHRPNPMPVTYETLRQMTERDTLMGSIVNTRIHQVASFCREQENKYSIGNLVRFRDRNKRQRRMTNGERDRAKKVEYYVQHMGQEESITRDGFTNAMKKMTRDTLTYDQINWENQLTRGGKLFQSVVHDPQTIRIADQSRWNPRGIPLSRQDEKTRIMYAQILNGEIVAEFTARELAFCIRNPRSSVKVGGYGFPEPQILIQTVTAHIWAEEWNRKAFSQGSTIKGVLNMKGTIDRTKYEGFKRQWMAQVGGITNAWKTPIMNSDGIEFVPMQMSNTEMGYQMWIEYLVKIACAIYQMDPTEINFDLRGSSGAQQPTFMSGNEAQQKLSKDRGLKPLLRFFEDAINRNIVHQIDPELELAFVGLDAKSEEQAVDLRQKQGATMLTINELRELEDLGPVEHGNIVANPVYVQYLTQQQMSQQGGGGGMPGQQPGGQPGEEQQPAEQPYGGRFGQAGSPPTPGAQQGAQNLHAMAAGPEQHEDVHEEDADIRMLRRDDWQSTVHASLRDNDLRKSMREVDELFFDIDL